jgi:hypothetical protein
MKIKLRDGKPDSTSNKLDQELLVNPQFAFSESGFKDLTVACNFLIF